MDHLRNALSRKRLLPEPSLDVVQHLSVRWVGLIQDILEREIRRTKAVAEMLGEDPAAI